MSGLSGFSALATNFYILKFIFYLKELLNRLAFLHLWFDMAFTQAKKCMKPLVAVIWFDR